ncbi:MAG: ABC transporter permease [Planctomycetaceae bacterium]
MSSALIESEIDRPEVPEPPVVTDDPPVPVTIVEPDNAWSLIDFRELYAFRDLFRFLVWRNVKVMYAQSALGIAWAVIQPLFSMVVFTIIFGKLAKIDSDGVPYAVFSFAALVPWTYFANSLTEGTNSLVANSNMISKVYFPRMILPLSAVMSKLVDFSISMLVLFVLMAWYGVTPNWGVLALPLLIGLMVLTAAGLGMWLTALAIQYRDVKYAMTFVVQILMYAAPVVYSVTIFPETYTLGGVTVNPRLIYSLNPLVGVIEGFRSALLGTRGMPWTELALGSFTALVVAASGAMYFRRKEQIFADVA